MNGIQRNDLNIVFASHADQSCSDELKLLLIRSGYAIVESRQEQLAERLKNLGNNAILVLSIDLSHLSQDVLISIAASKQAEVPCFCVFHCSDEDLCSDLLAICCDFVIWPCTQSELFYRLHALVGQKKKKAEFKIPSSAGQGLHSIIGQSENFLDVLKRVKVFSECDAPVMIEGETGTGKEMIARAVHYYSGRKEHPFIPVNCGALPEHLIENELFGHHKGAYTDATASSKGLVGQAEGGTLFLDEMESLSLKGQVALLRLLQEQEYKPLGSSIPIRANLRIVTATNIPLKSLVDRNVIRQDLFYRLNILSVEIPPLRKRKRDIVLLAEHFLSKYQQLYQISSKRFSSQTLDMMKNHYWPGNVRELENMIHRAFLIATQDVIRPSDCEFEEMEYTEEAPFSFPHEHQLYDISFNEAKSSVIKEFEKHYLSSLMTQFHGNVTLAAKKACKERRALGKLLKKHGIERLNFV